MVLDIHLGLGHSCFKISVIVEPILNNAEQFLLGHRFLCQLLVFSDIILTGSENRIVAVHGTVIDDLTVRSIHNDVLLTTADDRDTLVSRLFLFLDIAADIEFRQRIIGHNLLDDSIEVLRIVLGNRIAFCLGKDLLRDTGDYRVQELVRVRNLDFIHHVIADIPDNTLL